MNGDICSMNALTLMTRLLTIATLAVAPIAGLACAHGDKDAGHDHGSGGMECCKEMASGGGGGCCSGGGSSCCSMGEPGGEGHGAHGGQESTTEDKSAHEGHQHETQDDSAAHEGHDHSAVEGQDQAAGGEGQMGRGRMGRGGMGEGRMGEGRMSGMSGGGPRGGAMHTAMTLVHNHTGIERTVEEIPGGIRSVTTAKDPRMVETLRRHIREMDALIDRGGHIRAWDPLFREISQRAKEIKIEYKDIEGGIEVIETSDDPEVTKLIRAHAYKVNEFVKRGMEAFHESTPLPADYKREPADQK
jgi:hypothetical protein